MEPKCLAAGLVTGAALGAGALLLAQKLSHRRNMSSIEHTVEIHRQMEARCPVDGKWRITRMEVQDVRFPTSDHGDGSDAIHKDPDYSCVNIVLHTSDPGKPKGHGFTFTLGRGNEVVALCCHALAPFVVGREVAPLLECSRDFSMSLLNETQLRWIGPDKGVVHLAAAAIINAVWDMRAKCAGLPLWKYLASLSPERLVAEVDFQYLEDELTPARALEILRDAAPSRDARIKEMEAEGFPCYTTSAGWLGYSDEKIKRLCREYMALGYNAFKMKVGADIEDDVRRAGVIRQEIGPDRRLMMDSNQRWGVQETLDWMERLKPFNPYWIEEPTSPDDALGHGAIARGLKAMGMESCGVATGEVCQNKVLWKQLFQAEAIAFAQIDTCRVAGINELLAILLMAKNRGVPVCPHAGGVGLCEYVRHIIMFDYVCVSQDLSRCLAESTTHLHEHFHDTENFLVHGRYRAPRAPGYATLTDAAVREFSFPGGTCWLARESKTPAGCN